MVKYWDAARIKRVRERQKVREDRAFERSLQVEKAARSYSKGDDRKNMGLMLDALGLPLRRAMVLRLQKGGAMSLSKLSEPYGITLPAALKHTRILEESGIITTHKRGRVRICVYNPLAFKELAHILTAQAAMWESSFDRLEKHLISNKKR